MELFFGMELPQHVTDCLLAVPREQFGFQKDSNLTVEEIVEITKTACLEGKVYIIYDTDVVLFFTDQSPYVLHMDSVRGLGASIFDYSKVLKRAFNMFTKKTEIHKIETRTPFKELNTIAKRVGFELEGTHKQSYQMPDGSFADELSFGIILKREEHKCRSSQSQ